MLVVEDDDRLAAALGDALAHHGFAVTRVGTGTDALQQADGHDIVLLDLGLPDIDGFEVCRRLRTVSDVPVIAVTARAEQDARLHGLNLGADDYLVKPYDLRELVARIHAVTRRTARAALDPDEPPRPLQVGDVTVDVAARRVTVAGAEVALTAKEFDLLALLAGQPGVVFRREQILSGVWGSAWKGHGHTLEVHVGSLRAKLGRPGLVGTVRGVGYRLEV